MGLLGSDPPGVQKITSRCRDQMTNFGIHGFPSFRNNGAICVRHLAMTYPYSFLGSMMTCHSQNLPPFDSF
jgi:hypothetical protein